MFLRLLSLIVLFSLPAMARQSYSNWCQQGNQTVTTSGVSSTTKVQRSYPSCTVTVYVSGTLTLATLYSDNSGTSKANPFTANVGGNFIFYASNGRYDVVMSAGGMATPFTISDILLYDGPATNSVTSLNGLTGALTIASGTNGTDFAVSASGATVTLNLPTASATNRGALSTTDWSTFNSKEAALTFSAPLSRTGNTVSLTTPLSITYGGTGASTQTTAFNALSPLTTKGDIIAHNGTNNIRVAVGTNGKVLVADSGQASGLNWATTVSAIPVPVSDGGTGATSLTGIPVGSGTSAFTAVAASSIFQTLRRKANQTSTTYEFSSPPYLVSSDFDFAAQQPGGTLTAAVGATPTMTPCPAGLNGADTGHYIYISGGTGSAEAVLITGGTCTSGAASGTVAFTPANNHSGAWTITSATNGLQEAVCFLPYQSNTVTVPNGTTTLNQNVSFCGKTNVSIVLSTGVTLAGTGKMPPITNTTATITDYRSRATNFQSNLPIFAQTASVTVASTAAETTVTGAGQGSLTLPANFFNPGKTLKIKIAGIHSAVATPTIRWKVKFGSTVVLDTTAVTSGNSTDQTFFIEGYITCRTAGGSGTVAAQGWYVEAGNATFGMPNTATITVDTTATQAVDVTVQWGTSSASNSVTTSILTLEDSL